MKTVTLIEHNLQGNKDMVCDFRFLVFTFFFFDCFLVLIQWVILIVRTELCSCSLIYKWELFGIGTYLALEFIHIYGSVVSHYLFFTFL